MAPLEGIQVNRIFRTEYGPLKPYQRPLVIMLMLLIPIIAAFTLSWLIFNYMYVVGEINDHEFAPQVITHETIQTAVTGNELTLQLRSAVARFDDEARGYFGPDHEWEKDGARFTPQFIDEYVHHEDDGENSLLREYFEISSWRVSVGTKQAEIEATLDASVSSLDEDTTKDEAFKAERLVWTVEGLIHKVDRQRARLKRFGEGYVSYTKGKKRGH